MSVHFWTDILLKPIMVRVHKVNAKMRWGYISKSGLHKFVGISFLLVSTCYSYIAYSHLIWLKIGVVDIEISMGKWSLENNFSTDAFFRWLNTKHNSRGVAKCDIAM